MATTTAPRYQVRPQRVIGRYVLDTHTRKAWTGLTTPGAQQLADHLNRAHTCTTAPAPVWRDQQLTIEGARPDTQQGALFAL